MRTSFAVIGATLAFAIGAAAQDAPRMEAFLGYTYTRFRPTSSDLIPKFSANGGSGQFAYNFNKYVSGVVDLGAVHNGNIGGFHIDSTIANFLFGPRVGMRYGRFRPYGQVLLGGVYAASSRRVTLIPVATETLVDTIVADPDQAVTARISNNHTAFALTAGGGFDIKINKYVSFRPLQVEYFLTRLTNIVTVNDNNQNNIRASAGFNFTFGAQ